VVRRCNRAKSPTVLATPAPAYALVPGEDQNQAVWRARPASNQLWRRSRRQYLAHTVLLLDELRHADLVEWQRSWPHLSVVLFLMSRGGRSYLYSAAAGRRGPADGCLGGSLKRTMSGTCLARVKGAPSVDAILPRSLLVPPARMISWIAIPEPSLVALSTRIRTGRHRNNTICLTGGPRSKR
jgi:hypothetical protein